MTVATVDLRCNGTVSPLGVASNPRLSWRLTATERGVIQSACQVQMATDGGFDNVIWDSGRVDQRRMSMTCAAPAHTVTRRCWWRVRAWTSRAAPTEWSEPAWFEPGRASAEEWSARFIGAAQAEGDGPDPVPAVLLRKTFTLDGPARAARLAATALGVYDMTINSVRVGNEVLAPGWCSYNKRIAVSTFDVTELLREGENVIAATVAEGWYRGRIGVRGSRSANYGVHLGLLAELEVALASGGSTTIASDSTWTASSSSVVASGIYDGETIDLRREPAGWAEPGFDDSGWERTVMLDQDLSVLFNRTAPPVRRVGEVEPVERRPSLTGKVIVDFGQNLVGRLRVPLRGPAGAQVTIRHAEVLDSEGELFTRALNDAKATDTIVLAGVEPVEVEPRFTFHGFRYAEVTADGGAQVDFDRLRAVVISSDNERTGSFECSEPLVNRLQQNIEWSWLGNSVSLPTDCPQRSERLGWTGDAQVFAATACFVTDADQFLASWLKDLAVDQRADGAVPMVVPDVMGPDRAGAAAWGDAAVVVPWVLYEVYGDVEVLATQFPSMKAWVDYEAARAGDDLLWNGDFQFGDWCDPTAPPDKPGSGKTDRHLIAQAEFVRSATLVARTAAVLGESADADFYRHLATDARDAFRREYVDEQGVPVSRTQTSCAVMLEYDLVEDDRRSAVGELLVDLVRDNGNRLATGFVGTPVLLPALTSIGRADVAYDVFLGRECPSWLYPVLQGATTMWERWDAIQPDGSIHPGQMLSFNHYAYGAVGDWMYRTVAGLAPDAPGYERIRLAPTPGGGITAASARLRAVPGVIESTWRLVGDDLHYTVEIPANATGVVSLAVPRDRIQLDGSPLHPAGDGVVAVTDIDGGTEIELGSGRYKLKAGRTRNGGNDGAVWEDAVRERGR